MLDLDLIQYADDTTVLFEEPDYDILSCSILSQVPLFTDWFNSNGLSLNIAKTQFLTFQSNYFQKDNFDLVINSAEVNSHNSVKFLGITIDQHLNWKDHLDELGKKLNSACFSIRMIKKKSYV